MDSVLSFVVERAALGAMFGALVVLPAPAALGRLTRLRSAKWALVLPGMLIAGTFGVLAVPAMATWLAVLASVATPILAGIAVVAVVHGRRRVLLVVPVALTVAATLAAWPGQIAASVVTALGCLTLGVALARLIPSPWLASGVLAMCAVDVVLLGVGVGQPSAALLDHAMTGSSLPTLHHASAGSVTTDYPDLILAAVIGGVLAGRAAQWRGAVLTATLSGAYAGLLMFVNPLPATVPLALALVLISWGPRLRRRTPKARTLSISRGQPALKPLRSEA